MRLIDADALCTHIENEFDGVCVYDVSGNEAAREFCDMVDIAPAIDAIPVEWIQAQVENEKRAPLFRRYAEALLIIWQKEQEAR